MANLTRPRFVLEEMAPGDLVPNPANFRRHPDSQTRALSASVEEHGWVDAPLWNKKTGHLIDGHARVELALADGEAAIPVKVVDMPLAQERRLLRSFDAIGSMALVDDEALDSLIAAIDDAALEQLLGEVAEPQSGLLPEADPDALPERVETRVKAGDLWQLGEHRLLCGDCCVKATYESVMGHAVPAMVFADPPYGIDIVGDDGRVGSHGEPPGGYPFGGKKNIGKARGVLANRYAPVIGDDSPDTALDAFRLCESLWPRAVHIWWGANHYSAFLPSSPCWLVWDKETGSSDFADAELAWCSHRGAVRLLRHQWSGMIRDSERGEKRVHPTQKPVALAEWVYELYAPAGSLVADPFAGSGMSLIAAENTGRRWAGIEMAPAYCDVILARWEQATGREAVRL
jgi:hypothetical protein